MAVDTLQGRVSSEEVCVFVPRSKGPHQSGKGQVFNSGEK